MHGQSDKVVIIVITCLDLLSENLAIQTMLPVFYEQSYDPIVTKNQFSPQLATGYLGVLKRHNIDGVALFGFAGITEEMLTHWQSSLVLLARDTKGFASACHDDEEAIKILMQRLYGQGYHNISYLGVLHSDVMTGKQRHETYLVLYKVHKLHPVTTLPGLTMKQGREDVAKVITPETTTLSHVTSILTLGTSKCLQGQHIDTLRLVSVGNTPLVKFLHPETVTVDPDYVEAGRQAAYQLITRATGRSEPQQIIIPAILP